MAASQGKATKDISKGASAPESNLHSNKIDPKALRAAKTLLVKRVSAMAAPLPTIALSKQLTK